MKKIIFGFMIIMTVMILGGCQRQQKNSFSENDNGMKEENSSQIAPEDDNKEDTENKTPEELISIIWPLNLIEMIGHSADEQLDYFQNNSEKEKVFTKGHVNDDGSLTLEMTEEQLKYCKQLFEKNVDTRIVDEADKGIEIVVNGDYEEITYILSKDTSLLDFTVALQVLNAYAAAIQLFEGVDENDWHIKNVVIDKDSGKVVKEWISPDEEINIKPEDWD